MGRPPSCNCFCIELSSSESVSISSSSVSGIPKNICCNTFGPNPAESWSWLISIANISGISPGGDPDCGARANGSWVVPYNLFLSERDLVCRWRLELGLFGLIDVFLETDGTLTVSRNGFCFNGEGPGFFFINWKTIVPDCSRVISAELPLFSASDWLIDIPDPIEVFPV